MARHSENRDNPSQFLDLQAAVDEYEEESNNEDEDIVPFVLSDVEENESNIESRGAAIFELEDEVMADLQRLIQRLQNTYGTRSYHPAPDPDDAIALQPTIQDAEIWMIRTISGSEIAAVFKIIEQFNSHVISAFAVPSCPARIYVEGRDPIEVWRACSRIPGVRATKGMALVPVDDRIDLFRVRSEDRRIKAQTWVRLRRGPNKGDLAYVLRAAVNSDRVQIAVMPRISFTVPGGSKNGKRKRKLERLSARPFDPTEIKHVHGPNSLKQQGDYYFFENKTFHKGMLILNVQSAHTLLRVPSPLLSEIKPFIDAGFVAATAALAMTSGEVAASVRPGDYVELIAGEQSGCMAMVVTCNDSIASIDIQPTDSNLNAVDTPPCLLEVPLHYIRRYFRIGDNVRIREGAGDHAGSSGCVVAVFDNGQRLSFVEDKTRNTIEVLAVSVESFQPDYLHADAVNVQLDSQTKSRNPLVGRRVVVAGKHYYKGYVGYVQSVATGTAYIDLDANHRTDIIPLKDVIDFTNGRTLEGTEIRREWRRDFAKTLRDHFAGRNPRAITPPPEVTTYYRSPSPVFRTSFSRTPSPPPVPDLSETAWSITREDLEQIRKPYSGPGKWLLEPVIRANFDTRPITVRFKTEYDGGRWDRRTAKTLKSWFITERPLSHEIALTWTDNRGQTINRNVDVAYLEPARPLLNQRAVIIEGANMGDIGNIEKKNRRTKDFTVRLDDSDIYLQLPESALCRLADPE